MKVAKLIDNKYVIGSIFEFFPNVSFPDIGPPDSFLIENLLYKVKDLPSFNEETQKLIKLSDPILIDNYLHIFEVIDKSEDEIINEKWQKIRAKRDQLLLESDVYVLIDRWISYTDGQRTAYKDYRKKLRNIPQFYFHPDHVIWPDKPV